MDLSLDEKISLLSGEGMWSTNGLDGKIKSIFFSDGPHGIRKEIEGRSYDTSLKATCFPTASCLASSWDVDLISDQACGIAQEAIESGVDIVLGPGINIKRLPICGRNFEYFSEDPYLSGMLAASYIRAVEATGVGTSLKHFAVNNQEANRQTVNSQVDDRALREIYLRAFEIALSKSVPACVMTSYNRVNGYYASESKELLTHILKDEWGYKGCVISDWGACIDLAKSIDAGLDLEMPDSLGLHAKDLKKKLNKKQIDIRQIDRASQSVLDLVDKYSQEKILPYPKDIDLHEKAREIASQSAVLLKNDGILPLDKKEDFVLIGSLAKDMYFQGGGSSRINPKKHINILDLFKGEGIAFSYAPGYRLDSEEMDAQMIAKALDLAKKANKIIFFGGLTDSIEGEGFDRRDLQMPSNQLHLLKELSKLGKKIIYISFSGAPYRVDFLDSVSAFLQMYLAGEAVSEAIFDLIFGKVNPSGKLAETWPRDLKDVLSYDFYTDKSRNLEYRESIFVGYRYFDTYGIATSFDFGFGLSYSDFEYSNLSLDIDGEKGIYRLNFDLKNLGPYDASEVVQIYVKNPSEHFIRAKRELRGFKKVALKLGETKKVEVDLDDKAFSIFDVRDKSYLVSSGLYEIQVASSLNDIRLRKEIEIRAQRYRKVDRAALAQFFVEGRPSINRSSFEYLYDKRIHNFDKTWIGDYSLYNSLEDFGKMSWISKLIAYIILGQVDKMYGQAPESQRRMMLEAAKKGPFDAVISQSKIPFLRNVGLFMADLCNKRRLRALKSLLLGK
ncbi:MAG: glycoside hydrolase family 3 C-terminal domain-containing protein [Tissierellia bacterium]|nr:glycoside hydrolase family 3 C-terminal domain-containing protein [Tissierellia bacterium]